MAIEETFLQHWVFTRFALPFLLMFFIVYAVLEKTKVLGDSKQVNSWLSFVIALIFVSVAYPTIVASNLILFLTIAMVTMFVALLLWGFVSGSTEIKLEHTALKWGFGIVIVIAVVIALLWATSSLTGLQEFLFEQSWSNSLWTNVLFVVVIGAALAVALKK